MLKTAVVHHHHDQVNPCHANLQFPASSPDRYEGGRAPAPGRAAGSDATAVLAAHNETAFHQPEAAQTFPLASVTAPTNRREVIFIGFPYFMRRAKKDTLQVGCLSAEPAGRRQVRLFSSTSLSGRLYDS